MDSKLAVEITRRVYEIIQEIAIQPVGGFASYELVVQVLFDRFKVNSWRELGVETIEAIPIVHFLFNLNQKV